MRHHTKDKGDLGVAKVLADLIEHGYGVYLPISDHVPRDLIAMAMDGGLMKRVQVPYRSLSANGTVTIRMRNSHSDKNGVHVTPVDLSLSGCYALFRPQSSAIYYVRNDEIPGTNRVDFSLRVVAPRKNRKNKVNAAILNEGVDRLFDRPRRLIG